MTFLELQKKITQTRKARKGIKNRVDYLAGEDNEPFLLEVYQKALSAANQIVQHCIKVKRIEKFFITWGEQSNEDYCQKYIEQVGAYEKLTKDYRETVLESMERGKEIMALEERVRELERELRAANKKLSRDNAGRRKDYDKAASIRKYKNKHPDESVRGIAKALGISPTTVQKVLTENRK